MTRDRPDRSPASDLLRRHRPVFRAVTRTVVPEADSLGDLEWTDLESIVADALAPRPAALLRQLSLFLRVIDGLALVRHGRRFAGLDDAARAALLRRLETSRALLLRRGFWGLRTLALMGYYARAEAGREIGYRADARGWEARSA
jgi:hypothetical protein